MRYAIRAIFATLLLAMLPLAADAGVFVSVSFGPPLLPVYVPPPIPGPGYIWGPGYWAWDGDDYYWVPGTWMLAPAVGLLWTPGYWGWGGGVYAWHGGYWGPHVGFYGGIDYGYGYGGVGYHGGYWRGSTFIVNNTVINEAPAHRVAFNGGAGGVAARPTPAEMQATHEHHVGMSEEQTHHEQLAARDKTMRASFNHGRPPVAATQKPGVFYGHGVVAARAAPGPAAMTASHQGPHGSYAGSERATAHTGATQHVPQAPQAPHPMMHEQYGGHAGSAPPARGTYSGGGAPAAARPTYPSGGGHGGYQGGPPGAPANSHPQAHPQGHAGERPAEHGPG
jgi:hypothetical protein